MTLESQMPRTTTWRTRGGKGGGNGSGRSGPDRRLVAILVGAVIVAVAVVVIYFMGGKKPTTPDVAQGNLNAAQNGSDGPDGTADSGDASTRTARRGLNIQDPTAKGNHDGAKGTPTSPTTAGGVGNTNAAGGETGGIGGSGGTGAGAEKPGELVMGKDAGDANPAAAATDPDAAGVVPASTPTTGAESATGNTPGGSDAGGGGGGGGGGGLTSELPGTQEGGPPSEVRDALAAAERATRAGDLVAARTQLNRALQDSRLAEAERGAIRAQLADIAEKVTFSPTIAPGDPLSRQYAIKPGDSLTKVASGQGLAVDWRLLQRVNRIKDPGKISVGQKIKLVQGPFHAVVDKSEFRLDLYAGEPIGGGDGQSQANPGGPEPGWTFIRSFPVGLGAKGGTPVGYFVVKPRSKLVNPPWVNPRTGEKFGANDPKNPIGEYWIGIEGADESSRASTGFGIHGTIEPQSIGREMSMGCVRLGAEDVALMYECLVEKVSVVKIVP